MTDKNPSGRFAGWALVDAIKKEAESRGMPLDEVAQRFEIAYSYWQSLASGHRPIQSLHPSRLRAIAEFLGRSYIEVLSLAELVTPEDFVIPQSIEEQLDLAYVTMRADNYWSTLVPGEQEWNAASRAMKILAVALYERLFQVTLLERAKVFTLALARGEPALQAVPTGAGAAEPTAAEADTSGTASATDPLVGNSDAPLTAA
jgi:transcriptional regulator with XRE-family HTH domain